MNALTFDTHAFIKRLISSGMPEAQAETVSDLVKETQENSINTLATKADLKEETAPLKAELLLVKWMVGFTLALVVGIFVKLFVH